MLFSEVTNPRNIEVLKNFIELQPFNLNQKDRDGWTLLTKICDSLWIEALKYLLTLKELDVNQFDGSGRTALSVLISKQAPLLVAHLLRHPSISTDADHHFFEACSHRSMEIVKTLYSKFEVNLNRSYGGHTCLSIACERGNLEVVKFITTQKVLAGDENWHQDLLYSAINGGHLQVVIHLLNLKKPQILEDICDQRFQNLVSKAAFCLPVSQVLFYTLSHLTLDSQLKIKTQLRGICTEKLSLAEAKVINRLMVS